MPAKKQPVNAKHDWVAMKKEFMAGDWLEVSPFLRYKLGENKIKNRWARLQTKGWGEEKQALKEAALKKGMEKIMADSTHIAESALKALLINIAEQARNGDLPAADKKILWSMLRVEANKPTSITAGEMKQKISIEDEPTILPKF